MSGEHDICPGCGAEAWCCICVDLTDRCTTHHICPCLQAKLEAAEAEVKRFRLEWLHMASHDPVFTAEVNEEHSIDLEKIPISEASLAGLNLSIDRQNRKLLDALEAAEAEVERLVLELRAIEWQGGACGRCPNCLGYEPEHKPDCTLADALEPKE